MCTLATRTAPKTRPVSGSARWLDRWDGSTGCLEINGTAYAVRAVAGGFRLHKEPDGRTVYDVNTEAEHWTCDCPDYLYRRAGLDPKGCKHCAALRAALAK